MAGAADAGRAQRRLMRLGPGDQFGQRRGLDASSRNNDLRRAWKQRDRFEIADKIISQRIDGSVEDVRAPV
jgi:hypothetical protein